MNNEMQIEGFGTTNYDKGAGGGGDWKRPFKIEPGKDNIYGILPGMKSLQNHPRGWKNYIRLHWGYSVPQTNDPTKTRMINFKCIQKRNRDKMVTQDCPECTLYDQNQERLKQAISAYQQAGKTAEEIDTLTKALSQWLQDHRPQSKWWMNAINVEGKFSRLGISHKSMLVFEQEIEAVRKQGLENPISISSMVLWNFTRTSQRVQEMTEIIKPYAEYKEVPGYGRVPIVKTISLTREQAMQALKECDDLTAIGLDLSYAQIQAIVQSSGDPEEIQAIVGLSQKVAQERIVTPPVTSTQVATAIANLPTQQLGQVFAGVFQGPAVTVPETVAAPAPVVTQAVAPTQVQVGFTPPAAPAQPAPAVFQAPPALPPGMILATPPAPTGPAGSPAQNVLAQVSDEAFLAQLGG